MTNTHIRSGDRRRTRRRNWLVGTVATIAIVGGASVAIARALSDTSSKGAYVQTGESNSMGMQVIETPGSSTGTASATGITATPSAWALGRVPLDVAVRPTWTMMNTGTDSVTIGEPHVQINQGCYPGPFTVSSASTLAPGAEAVLTFELSMHPGMDGAHDMTVHVPVQHPDGSIDTLTLSITGDFRN